MNAKQKIILLRARRSRKPKRRVGRLALQGLAAILLLSVVGFVVTVAAGVATAMSVYANFAKDLPEPNEIETAQEDFETTKIYDRTGQVLLMEVIDPRYGDRTLLPLDVIPEHMRNATIALEDKNFYENPGVDFEGIARAFIQNLQGEGIQGGSSITVQLVKNVLIPEEERYEIQYSRKVKEAILALEITRLYSKDQILEWYLNNNYYGNWAYGVEAAAQVYFGKHAQDLTLAECTMLAPIVQYPALNPIDNPTEAKKRQKIALDRMVDEGYITPDEALAAYAETLDVHTNLLKRYDIISPHFAVYVRKQLEEMFEPAVLYTQGLRVYTTLDLDIQAMAEEEVRAQVQRLQEEKREVSNGAAIVLRNRTAEILAMVGSIDYWNEEIDGNVNLTTANRQPGSSFKPFSYITAFHQGHTAAEMIMDVRTCPNPYDPSWCPENYDRNYHGPQRIRLALGRSYNIPAVKVLDMAGVGNVIRNAHALGVTTLERDLDFYGLSLVLGSGEVKLLDMAYAFSVFANGGVMLGQPTAFPRPGYRELDPVSILHIVDKDGDVLYQYDQPEARGITFSDGKPLTPQETYLLTSILSDNAARARAFGVNNNLRLDDGRPVAAKTGTTTDYKDSWLIGYTPDFTVGAWVGNNDGTEMDHVPGSRGAGPIWKNTFTRLYGDGHAVRILGAEPQWGFDRPPGLTSVEVCAVSGMLPNEHCPNRVREIFIEGTEPTQHCTVHQAFQVNVQTGKLATVYTPPELVESRVYEIYPREAADWVRQEGIPQPPTEYDTDYGPTPGTGEVAIVEPAPYGYVSGIVPIMGNARGGDVAFYRLEFGQGLNPSAWSQIGGDHYEQVDRNVLEYWDVSYLESGLYTLQLTVVDHSQSYRQSTIQVTVDNEPPEVYVAHPWEGKYYEMEKDEWINIQADIRDNVRIEQVEFYFDDELLGERTVEPYNVAWTIQMENRKPVPIEPVYETRWITNPDGTFVLNPDGSPMYEVITVTWTTKSPDGSVITQTWNTGKMIIADASGGYTESHLIHIKAFDAAGNESESEKVRVFVIHEPEEEEEPTTAVWREERWAWLEPPRQRNWA
jgi:penicillin-binding protein 1C